MSTEKKEYYFSQSAGNWSRLAISIVEYAQNILKVEERQQQCPSISLEDHGSVKALILVNKQTSYSC